MSAAEQDLDDILNSALDDFDEEKIQEPVEPALDASEMEALAEQVRAQLDSAGGSDQDTIHANMTKFLEDAQNPEFQNILEQAFQELSTDTATGENIQTLLGSLASQENKQEEPIGTDVDVGVARTLQGMARAAEDMEGVEAAKAEEMGEDMMQDMMKEFEKMGEKKDFAGIVDGMMQQLLSKEVMYEPMKQICEKFPAWLAEKESLLEPAEYARYGKQYQYFQQLVAVYETEPDNYERLTELMQEMQECGQPPAEIVQELAPGLEFDEAGQPIMPNMGPGMVPQIPGQEQCLLM